MAHNAKRMTQLSQVLNIPIIATRHVQENFGDIDQVITDVTHPGRKVIDKHMFSMMGEPKVKEHLDKLIAEEKNRN